MRVLVATQTFDRSEEALYKGLFELGHDVTVACSPDAPGQDRLSAAGLRVNPIEIKHRLDGNASRNMEGLLDKLGINLVYASSNVAVATALRATRRLQIPVVGYRGTLGHISRLDPASWLTFLNPRLAHIVCVSDAVREYLASRGIEERKLVTIYKGHDPEWYDHIAPFDLRDEGVPADAGTIVFAGSVRPVKGIPFLLDALEAIPGGLDPHLLLLGQLRDPHAVRRIRRSGGRCHCLGHRDDVLSLVAACDVFALPSVAREGLPRAVIEAMCLGTPPVVTDVGGLPELVEDGVSGRVVPPRDPQAMAAAITVLLQDEGKRHGCAKNARERIATRFHIKDTIARTAQLFEEALS